MGPDFGMLRHDTCTKYISRYATNVTDTLFYGDNTTLLDEKKPSLAKIMSCHI